MRRRILTATVAAMVMGTVLFPATAFAKQPKVEICHLDEDNATYKLLSIPEKAAQRHVAHHEDGYPLGEVPNMDGFTFDENCGLVDGGPTGTPAVRLIKEVSVNGNNFFDANDEATALDQDLGFGGYYRFTVINEGTVALVNVKINDPLIGLVDHAIVDLDPGERAVFSTDWTTACQVEGFLVNTATVDAQSADTGETVSDSDPAVLHCSEIAG